jgi:hypothetical protein
MDKAIIKFNNGNLAIICSGCYKIIKVGSEFSKEEKEFAQGIRDLPAQYCKECTL